MESPVTPAEGVGWGSWKKQPITQRFPLGDELSLSAPGSRHPHTFHLVFDQYQPSDRVSPQPRQ